MAVAKHPIHVRELAHKYGFLDTAVISLIEQTACLVRDMIRDKPQIGRTATRKADLRYVIKHSRGLRLAILRLDVRARLSLMGRLKGNQAVHARYATEDDEDSSKAAETITIGLTPLRLVELEVFIDRLDQVEENASALNRGEKPDNRGAPPTSDFLLFGIEALAALWRRHHPAPIINSNKRGQFGAFVSDFFELVRPSSSDDEPATSAAIDGAESERRPTPSEVRTALRQFFVERLR